MTDETRNTILVLIETVTLAIQFGLQKPVEMKIAIDGDHSVDQIPEFRVPSSSTETTVRSFGFRRACLRLRSHAAFLRITRPPCTSVRVLPSFGSNTLTSAGSAARNPQKFGTPLYLNAAWRAPFAVSGGRRALAVRESRSRATESEGDDSGYGKGAGDGKGDESATGGAAATCTGVSYG
jgi:hypothetical protein